MYYRVSYLESFVVLQGKNVYPPTLNRQFWLTLFISTCFCGILNPTSYNCFKIYISVRVLTYYLDTGPFIGFIYFVPTSPLLRIISWLLRNNKRISKASSWIKLCLIVTVNRSLCLYFVTKGHMIRKGVRSI